MYTYGRLGHVRSTVQRIWLVIFKTILRERWQEIWRMVLISFYLAVFTLQKWKFERKINAYCSARKKKKKERKNKEGKSCLVTNEIMEPGETLQKMFLVIHVSMSDAFKAQ